VLAPTERQVEALATERTDALSLRRFVRDLSTRAAPELLPTTPEMTRLLTGRLLGVSGLRARGMDDALGMLRRAGTAPASLRATGTQRGKLLAKTLDGANAELRRHSLRDDRESVWLAARELAKHAELALSRGNEARLVGLVRWDAATLALIEALHTALARGGGGLRLELPLPEKGPLADAAAASFSALEARWATLPDAPSLVSLGERFRANVVAAHDAASEARAATRAVLEALERGVALDAIAIVPIELSEAFLEPLRFELTRAGVPFVEPRGRPALAAPRAHRALELLRLATGPIVRDTLLDVLRTPGLRLERWFGDMGPLELASELAKLPLRVDRTGRELLLDLDDRLSELEREAPGTLERLQPQAGALGAFLSSLAELSEPAPRSQLARRVAALFGELGLLEPPAGALREAIARAEGRRPELLAALAQDSVASRAIASALERTAQAALALAADDPVPLASFAEELDLALEGAAPLAGAARAGAVRIARPSDIAGLALDSVVLCRASDADLDRSPSQNAVLGDALSSQLPEPERPPTALVEHRFDLLAVASVLAACRRVTVTFATHDGDSTLGPSRLAMWLMDTGASLRREPASPLSPGAGRTTRPRAPSASAERRSAIELERQRFFVEPPAEGGPYSGRTQPLARHLGGSAERPIAVTALERALRCRFLGFMGSVLKATRDDPVGDAITARERGSLLHAALAEALEATRGRFGIDSPAELEARAFAAAKALLERKGRGPLRRAGLAATLLDVRAVLKKTFALDEGLTFKAAELAFGQRGTWPPLAVGSLFVSGRIDRIDVTSDGRRTRVIDYKTRLPAKGDAEAELQPWLYAEKAGQELAAEQTSFAYFGVNQRAPEQRLVYEGAAGGDAVRIAFERAEGIYDLLAEGRVEPIPRKIGDCTRCIARDACRRPLSAPDPNADRGDA
jgi:RecB family exonuclease